MQNRHKKSRAFTLVEILTTVAIIGILLAVLIPALNQVGKKALVVKQKAQFHAIEMGLEAFRTDFNDYPPSVFDDALYPNYTPSQRLAEAIIGMDGLGCHQNSKFNPSDGLYALPDKTMRKGPYLELESANAVMLSNIYPAIGTLVNSYVLADSFRTVKHRTTGKKTGMPILYYKADTTKIGLGDPISTNRLDWYNYTYNLDDSYRNGSGLLSLVYPLSNMAHPLGDPTNASVFYTRIHNPNFTRPPLPYRAESFILHSAGPDGLYGTADDVFNFDEEQ